MADSHDSFDINIATQRKHWGLFQFEQLSSWLVADRTPRTGFTLPIDFAGQYSEAAGPKSYDRS